MLQYLIMDGNDNGEGDVVDVCNVESVVETVYEGRKLLIR